MPLNDQQAPDGVEGGWADPRAVSARLSTRYAAVDAFCSHVALTCWSEMLSVVTRAGLTMTADVILSRRAAQRAKLLHRRLRVRWQ